MQSQYVAEEQSCLPNLLSPKINRCVTEHRACPANKSAKSLLDFRNYNVDDLEGSLFRFPQTEIDTRTNNLVYDKALQTNGDKIFY